MARTTTIRAADLVLDFDLYPRHRLDDTNIRRITDALEAGEKLPPVIACSATNRVADGFHRTEAVLRRDPDGTIRVQFHDYPTEQDLFLDAVARNARHGVTLNNWDRARVIQLGDRLGVDPAAVAGALAVTIDVTEKLRAARTAYTPDGQPVAIKRSARHLAGHQLTERQERANRRSQGWPVWFHCDQIVNAIEGDLVDWTDQKNREGLDRLTAALEGVLAR